MKKTTQKRHFEIPDIADITASTGNIILEIQQDNKDSFKEFFTGFYPVLCLFAEKFLKEPDPSKDVAQDAFIKFWEKRNEFTGLNHAKGFLYTVVKNNCINLLKRSAKSETLSMLKEMESESFFMKNFIEKETFMLLRSSVESLPERMKTIIECSLIGMKNHEIADKMQISAHTVHTAKKNAYKKLRELIKDIYLVFV